MLMNKKIKIILAVITLLGLIAVPVSNVHAASIESICSDYPKDPPDPQQIVCPIARGLNVVLLSVGAFFVVMVLVTSIKFAMSQGDFKGILGAKNSLTWAVAGFLGVAGMFGIIALIGRMFGIKLGGINNVGPFLLINNGLLKLMQWANLI